MVYGSGGGGGKVALDIINVEIGYSSKYRLCESRNGNGMGIL